MKISTFLLIVCILQISANGYTQSKKFDISLADVTVKDVLKNIENQSDFRFFYNDELSEVNRVISIDRQGAVVNDILADLFKDTRVTFRILENNLIVISPADLVQQKKVTGRVTDSSSGEPIPGVTVLVEGTTIGITTDSDGKYELTVPSQSSMLSFSFIGFLAQKVQVGSNDVLDIRLEPEVQALDEVVVIGYGVQRKSDVTGAISKVKTTDLQSRSALTAEKAMQGKVAGVQVINTSGAPGAAGTIRVRGVSSNNASQPLYVVDGLISTDIAGIDPNDIESIEILKDAASAAIYGVASGNGVVLLTTKKGKPGEGKITYDFQYTTSKLPRIPEIMNSQEYINYMIEGAYLTQAAFNDYWDGSTNTDWLGAVFENGITSRHNLGFQGGNERSSYYISTSYSDQDGIVVGDKDTYKRLGGILNFDYKIKQWLKVGTTNILEKWDLQTVSEANEYGGLLGAALTQDPLTPISYSYADLPDYMLSVLNGGVYPLLTDPATGNYWAWSNINVQDMTNPMIIRDQTDAFKNGFNLNGTLTADFNPVKGLTLTTKLGYRVGYVSNYSWQKPYYGNTIVNREDVVIGRENEIFYRYQWDNYANYLKNFGDHNLALMAGVSYIQPYSNKTGGSVNEILKDEDLYRDINYQTPTATRTVSGSESNTGRLYSLFGRANYGYKSKYLVQVSLRRDAGDRNFFPEKKNIGIFPAVSFGYVISQEEFFPKNNFISNLKLRASWGQNGTYAHLNGFLWRASIASAGSVPYTEALTYQSGSAPNRLENPELTWETTEQTNIGLDLRALKDKLSFNFDWYVKTSKDLLVTITPPYETGQSSATINAGNVRNSGIELELGWQDNIGDFRYGINANTATLKNKVTYLDPSISRINGASMHISTGLTVFEEGYPVWYLRGWQFSGVDAATGNAVFVDQPTVDTNGDGEGDEPDGVINESDKVMLGKGIPDLTYGITLNAGYKGFDLQIFGAGQSGSDIYNCFTRSDRPNGNKLKYFYDDRWTASNTNGSIPKPGSNMIDYFYASSGVVFNGSFFKIKQIQLGYTVPSALTKKVSISNLRVYCSLDDYITFSDYIGYDPEVSTNAGNSLGVDKGSYPIAKKILFGVNLTF
ncbi:MAG TPA: TonB-dependent receptor [Bacteroidales bacterium]|nr:TonB-dependent receptor [Bacteroidales bacterium]